MAVKLSQLKDLLEANGYNLDDIEDDELGNLAAARKSHKANQEGFTKATQRASDLERLASEKIQEWSRYANGLEGKVKQLEDAIAQRVDQVDAAGDDYRTDPLFKGLVKDLDKLTSGIDAMRSEIGVVARGVYVMANQYGADKKRFYQWINEVDKERAKAKLGPDFDADAVEKWAQEKGVTDTWEGAYTKMKAEKFPEEREQFKKQIREETLKEFEEQRRDPEPVHMGGPSRPNPPIGERREKTYEGGWESAVRELEKVSRNGG